MTKAKRARYALEFKLEAVRLVKGAQSAAAMAKILTDDASPPSNEIQGR